MSMKNEISFWPSRFASLRDTVPVPTTWGDLVEEIRGGRHLTVTRLYRETCARLAEAEAAGDIASVEELKRRKVSLKTSQAAFVCSVTLEGGRSQQHVRGYSDKAMVDIDDLNGKSLDTLVGRVKADPHTFLAYVTLSGRGLRVVARVEPAPTDARTFARAWQTVNDYYARLLGVTVDAQCKNATRMSVLCHDPEVCYRPEAEALVVEPEAPARSRASRGRPVRAVSAAPTVRRLVEDDGILYAPGSHNAYICRCLYWMNRFGVSEADAEAWALSEFADYDAAEHSVAATVRSCYALTAEHATCRLARYARARTSKDKSGGGGSRAPRVSVEQMEDFIGRWCQLRRNLLIHQLEVRLMDGAGEEEPRWQLMTDALENSLWRAMQHEGLDADLFRLRTLLQSDFVPTYHPLRRYLDTLPPWDGTTDYIGRLARMVVCRGTSAAEFDYYFRRWLVGMLAAALDDGVVNHEILVLLGPQGSFKSSFLENLLPPCLRRYYTTKTNSQRLTKDDLFTMTENLLVNFEEIDSMQRPELNQLKAMTTTLYINERPAYGRVLCHGQQPPVPHRRHRQPPLAALRSGAHRESLDYAHRLRGCLCPGQGPARRRFPLLVPGRRGGGAQPPQPSLRSAQPRPRAHPGPLPPPVGAGEGPLPDGFADLRPLRLDAAQPCAGGAGDEGVGVRTSGDPSRSFLVGRGAFCR